MKVTKNSYLHKEKKVVADLAYGEVFRYKNLVYMMVNNCEGENPEDAELNKLLDDLPNNASLCINLVTAALCFIPYSENIKVIEGAFHITKDE